MSAAVFAAGAVVALVLALFALQAWVTVRAVRALERVGAELGVRPAPLARPEASPPLAAEDREPPRRSPDDLRPWAEDDELEPRPRVRWISSR